MKIDIYDGETGIFCWSESFLGNTLKVKKYLLDGYAVNIYDHNNPVGNYQDENIKTDSDGFAMPMKG